MREKYLPLHHPQKKAFSMFTMPNTLFIITHATLWSLMEVEIEGTNGWMYGTPSQCSGFFTFTNYHMAMNYIIILTLLYTLQPSLSWQDVFVFILYWNIWFVQEDVFWFFVNNITYSTAPWQSSSTKILCTGLLGINFVILFYIAKFGSKLNIAIVSFLQVFLLFYMNTDSGDKFTNKFAVTNPRKTYC